VDDETAKTVELLRSKVDGSLAVSVCDWRHGPKSGPWGVLRRWKLHPGVARELTRDHGLEQLMARVPERYSLSACRLELTGELMAWWTEPGPGGKERVVASGTGSTRQDAIRAATAQLLGEGNEVEVSCE
jgi:hypothetical protein